MRISDWSSDVCSSDLGQKVDPARGPERGEPVRRQRLDRREVRDEGRVARESLFLKDAGDFQNGLRLLLCPLNPGPRSRPPIVIDATRVLHRDAHYGLSVRSVQPPPELQLLMRISYAVFCLRKHTRIYLYQRFTTAVPTTLIAI